MIEPNYEVAGKGFCEAADSIAARAQSARESRRQDDFRMMALQYALARKLMMYDDMGQQVAAPIEDVLADADAMAAWLAGEEFPA